MQQAASKTFPGNRSPTEDSERSTEENKTKTKTKASPKYTDSSLERIL